jgi:methylmalonyl-CoA/ethylmalonyl-CoA epimerase
MTIRRIAHIGIAVRSIDAALALYETALGLRCSGREEVASQKVRVAFLPVGETNIELLEPTDPESPIAKFIEKNGEGVHHVAYLTDDIAGSLERARKASIRLINESPLDGAHGMQVAFLHPKSTFGVLTEFCAPGRKSGCETT